MKNTQVNDIYCEIFKLTLKSFDTYMGSTCSCMNAFDPNLAFNFETKGIHQSQQSIPKLHRRILFKKNGQPNVNIRRLNTIQEDQYEYIECSY